MDIFDLVSGMQKEAIKEEKLDKERKRELKERRRVKEMNRGKEREKEADREKGNDNKEVLCRTEENFEFHTDVMCQCFIIFYFDQFRHLEGFFF